MKRELFREIGIEWITAKVFKNGFQTRWLENPKGLPKKKC